MVTEDLLAAVESHKIAAYVTDFPAEEMLGNDAIVAFPHLGASTPESEDNCAVMAAQELSAYLETGNITHSVNLPNITLPRTPGMPRVCVIHLNVSGLINKLTSVISEAGGNIENMISGSRKEYAYTLFDLSGNLPRRPGGEAGRSARRHPKPGDLRTPSLRNVRIGAGVTVTKKRGQNKKFYSI